MTTKQLIAVLRQECEVAGSQKAWAASHGLSAVYVSDVLAGRRAPAGKILTALGVERVVSFRKAGRD